jgi:putative ABC transport system permease protein
VKLIEIVADGLADVRAHAGRTFLQTLGVVLGVASVVATLGLTAGGRQKTMGYFEESGGLRKVVVGNKPLEVVRAGAAAKASRGLTLADLDAIRASVKGFDLTEPEVGRRLLVRTPLHSRALDVTGVGAAYPELQELILERGRFLTDDDIASSAAVCVLGAERATDFFGTEDPVGKRIVLGRSAHTVVGVLQHREFYWNKAENYNALGWMNRLILVPVSSMLAREVGAGSDQVQQLVLRLESLEAQGEAVPALRRLLLARHGAEDFRIVDRQERMQRMDQEGRVYDLAFLLCGVISLVVGGIVVANILLASFTERMREVGLRKALGAKGWHIAVQFLMESLVVTGLGGLLGLLLGTGFVTVLNGLLDMPAALTPAMVVAAVAAAGVIGVVFGFYPAIRAARLDPVAALRYE